MDTSEASWKTDDSKKPPSGALMPKAIRSFIKLLSVLVVAGLISCVFLLALAAYFNAPPPKNSLPQGPVNFLAPKDESTRLEGDTLFLEVRSGETASSVGRRLENANIIRSRYFWYLLFRLDKEFLKTGAYKIALPASQMRIRSILTSGEQLLVRVTVPEGFTLKKTAGVLEGAGICGAEDFLKAASSREILDAYNVPGPSMEGYLYPDTYLFPFAYPANKVVSAMADTFFKNFREMAGEIPGLGADISAVELNRRVIIASIVEREYLLAEEAALMAGVFFNRLNIGMALQSCATIEYVITEIEGRPHPDVLYNADLEIRNPYNTYMRPGLPPGPISAPGKTALKAAFEPQSTRYLYFRLMDPLSGRHYFSQTLDDHIKAEFLYTKGR